MSSSLALIDKALGSLSTNQHDKAAGYIKGLETRVAKATKEAEFEDSMPVKIWHDALRVVGAGLRGAGERLADAYDLGDTYRRAAPYAVGVAYGAGAASGLDFVREMANGASTIDAYELGRGTESRRAAAEEVIGDEWADFERYLATQKNVATKEEQAAA